MQDLARLVAELLLLVGLPGAVVDDRAGQRHDVVGDRCDVLRRRRERHRPAVEGQPGRPIGHRPHLAVELGDAGAAGAGDGLIGRDLQPDAEPAARCSGLSTGIAAIVVQLGLAMMPLGGSIASSGLTSETTSGTSGSIRQAEELSITIAPAAATLGAVASEAVLPLENRAMSSPAKSAVAVSSTVISLSLNGSDVPAERAEREEPDVGHVGNALRDQLSHHAADLSGGTEYTNTHAGKPRARRRVGVNPLRRVDHRCRTGEAPSARHLRTRRRRPSRVCARPPSSSSGTAGHDQRHQSRLPAPALHPVVDHVLLTGPEPDGDARCVRSPQRRRLGHLRPDHVDAELICLELHQQLVHHHSAVHLQLGQLGRPRRRSSPRRHRESGRPTDSSTARHRWPLLTYRVSPTRAPRASERQYGANRPENAGTM